MLILVHRDMNVLYVWLDSSKYMYRLQSYGKKPITSGSPLVLPIETNNQFDIVSVWSKKILKSDQLEIVLGVSLGHTWVNGLIVSRRLIGLWLTWFVT